MLSSVDVERKVFPIIMQCLDGMDRAANSINEKEVIIVPSLHIRAIPGRCNGTSVARVQSSL